MAAGLAACVLLVHVVAWLPATLVLSRSIDPPAVQSVAAFALAAAMAGASQLRRRRVRLVASMATLTAFLVAAVVLPLPFERRGVNFMGDGEDFSLSRREFEENIPLAGDRRELHFKAHLGDLLLARYDAMFGRDAGSAALAYQALSRTGGALYAVEIALLIVVTNGSRRALRYAALALMAPVVVAFFGYYEVGYLAVSAAAFPLLAMAVTRRRESYRAAAGALQGLHAALHGFGLLGIAGGVATFLAAPRTWKARLSGATTYLAFAIACSAGWVILYIVIMKVSVTSDPAASNIAIRPIADPFYFDRRLVHPLVTSTAFAEIGAASLATGVPLLVAMLLYGPRTWSVGAGLLYALPGLAFLVVWWPSLGVSRDMDLLFGAFAGISAAAWVASTSRRRTIVGLVVLACVHVFLWATLGTRALERIWLD